MRKIKTSENIPMPKMLRASDLIKILSISRATLTRWQQKGVLPKPIKIGRSVFWNSIEINKLLSNNQGK